MPEAPQPNEPTARTTEGTLLDQTPTTTSTPTDHEDAQPTESKSPAPERGPPAEYKFTAPEGRELDPKAIEGATAIFKELGLSQSQAQKLVEWGSQREAEISGKSVKVYDDMRAEWRAKTIADLEANYPGGKDAALGEINKVVSTLPPKLQTEFKDAMTLTGAGDHPAVVQAWLTIAKSINEGQHVSGGGPSPEGQVRPGSTARPSPAQAMYPTLPSASTH